MDEPLRTPVPGEFWTFSALEAHCFLMELDRIGAFLDEKDGFLTLWRHNLAIDAAACADVGFSSENATITLVPTERDRGFFEALAAQAQSHLWLLVPNADEEDGVVLPCNHRADEHRRVIQEWTRRETTLPKHFTRTREKLAELPLHEKLAGPPIIAREDLDALVELAMEEQLRLHRFGDREELRKFDAHPEKADEYRQRYGFSSLEETRERLVEALERGTQRILEQLKEQYREQYEQTLSCPVRRPSNFWAPFIFRRRKPRA